MKNLFLVTKEFPFGHSENYVYHELQYLCKNFDKVFIYPNDYYHKNEKHLRNLPANVEVVLLNQSLPVTANSIKDYFFLLLETVKEFMTTDDKKYFFKNFRYNLRIFWIQYKLALHFKRNYPALSMDVSDTLFYTYWFSKGAIFLAILKKKNIIKRFVARAHSIDLYHNAWGFISAEVKVPPYKMFKLRSVDQLFLISEHAKKFVTKKMPTIGKRSKIFYLGVDDMEAGNKGYENAFVLVTCSSIDHNKRLYRLAEVLSAIKIPLTWYHFGDGAYRNKVEKLIAQFPSHVTGKIIGNVPNDEVRKFYSNNNIDLFVNLSKVEGLPVSIMEAMSAGIPVLATDVYGTPEAVKEGVNGFLLDIEFKNEELLDKINYFINHREELLKMGEASRRVFLEKFQAKKNYSDFANYLKSI